MSESLSTIQRALLNVFRQKGARAGDPVPDSVLRDGVAFSGGPGAPDSLETALLDLVFRGVISPGPDPLAGRSWVLTASGDAIVFAA